MAAPKRSKAQRESDLAEMAGLLARGATLRALCERFELSLGTVQRDVATIEKRWADRAQDEIAHWKGRLLAGHDATIEEAWIEWERSKVEATKIVEVTELTEEHGDTVDADAIATGEPVRPKVMVLTQRTVTTEAQTGDPRYQSVIIAARAEQAKILGAHAPAKLMHSGPDGGPLAVQVIEIVPPDSVQPEVPS